MKIGRELVTKSFVVRTIAETGKRGIQIGRKYHIRASAGNFARWPAQSGKKRRDAKCKDMSQRGETKRPG